MTAYGRSKVLAEQEIKLLADDNFSPVFLRNATAYGVSPRLRMDLVVNDFVGTANATGEIHVMSDGTPWRPLIHIADISRALIAALDAPRERVHNESFNVGADQENYRISDVASLVAEATGAEVAYRGTGGPDTRSYRVTFAKIAGGDPQFRAAMERPPRRGRAPAGLQAERVDTPGAALSVRADRAREGADRRRPDRREPASARSRRAG